MTDTPEIAAARIEVERSRAAADGHGARASGAAQPEDARPKHLARREGKGRRPCRGYGRRGRARPLAATGVVAAITMFLAREPLIDLAGKLVDGVERETHAKKRRKTPEQGQGRQERKTETVE